MTTWITIQVATPQARAMIERKQAASLASDACVAIMDEQGVVGWGDDYGTFHPMWDRLPATVDALREYEMLLQAASDIWARNADSPVA